MKKKHIIFLVLISMFIPTVEAKTIVACGTTEGIPAFLVDFVRFAFQLIKYAVPILIVVVGSFEFFKATTSSNADMLKKAWQSFSKKLIAGALVFFLILMFQTVIRIASKEDTTSCISCFLTDKNKCIYTEIDNISEYGPTGSTGSAVDNRTDFDDTSEGTLTKKEIEELIGTIPSNLSSDRRKILDTALSAVGKIPYYYGGYALKAGFDGNNFGTKVSPDVKGRTKKGLDCSHFVDWVFLTAIGDNLGNGTTSTIWGRSHSISKSELKVGDIAFLENDSFTGTSNHIGIYVGNDLWVHETGGNHNNVIVSSYNWKYYRRILND